jgi:hypothetical protein
MPLPRFCAFARKESARERAKSVSSGGAAVSIGEWRPLARRADAGVEARDHEVGVRGAPPPVNTVARLIISRRAAARASARTRPTAEETSISAVMRPPPPPAPSPPAPSPPSPLADALAAAPTPPHPIVETESGDWSGEEPVRRRRSVAPYERKEAAPAPLGEAGAAALPSNRACGIAPSEAGESGPALRLPASLAPRPSVRRGGRPSELSGAPAAPAKGEDALRRPLSSSARVATAPPAPKLAPNAAGENAREFALLSYGVVGPAAVEPARRAFSSQKAAAARAGVGAAGVYAPLLLPTAPALALAP